MFESLIIDLLACKQENDDVEVDREFLQDLRFFKCLLDKENLDRIFE